MVRRRQIEKRTDIWHQLDGDNAKSVAAQCNIRIIRVEEVRAVKCSVSADLERATAHWWSQSAALLSVRESQRLDRRSRMVRTGGLTLRARDTTGVRSGKS